MQSAEQLGQRIGVQAACDALSVPRSSLYRARRPHRAKPSQDFAAPSVKRKK